jgi:hypothetical protein
MDILCLEHYELPLFEVSPYRSSILKKIDKDFAELKKDNRNVQIKKDIISNIKEFTGIKSVLFSVKKDYFNASVIPVYNRALSLDLLTVCKKFEAGESISDLNVVEEPSKYIDKLVIIFGNTLIKQFTPRELTAILLHELGHGYIHTSNLPRLLVTLFDKVGRVGGLITNSILWFLKILTFNVSLFFTMIFALITRTATFFEHQGEFKADQFAAKYGYGDEMIKILYKFHNFSKKEKDKQNWLVKILNYLSEVLRPSSHPEDIKRIIKISEVMMTDYKKMYPQLSDELSIILTDIKKQI